MRFCAAKDEAFALQICRSDPQDSRVSRKGARQMNDMWLRVPVFDHWAYVRASDLLCVGRT